jgi:hypothetical protein
MLLSPFRLISQCERERESGTGRLGEETTTIRSGLGLALGMLGYGLGFMGRNITPGQERIQGWDSRMRAEVEETAAVAARRRHCHEGRW